MLNNAEEKRYSIINSDNTIIEDYLEEHQVFSEIFLNISRILGYFILFVISLFNNILYFKLLLVVVSISIIFYSILMIKINNITRHNI